MVSSRLIPVGRRAALADTGHPAENLRQDRRYLRQDRRYLRKTCARTEIVYFRSYYFTQRSLRKNTQRCAKKITKN